MTERFIPTNLLRRVAAAFAAALWLWGALGGVIGAGIVGSASSASAFSLTSDGDLTKIVICTAQGMVQVTLDGAGQIIDSAPADTGDDDGGKGKHHCPCVVGGGMLAIAAPPVAMLMDPPQRAAQERVETSRAADAPPPIRGPPVGPRAPPVFG